MANFELPENPGYNDAMRKLETTDPAHADVFNALYAQLLENGEYLKQQLETQTVLASEKGEPGGVAELDDSGKVLSSQLPSYVDDVLEYNTLENFPETGESGKIYVAKDTNITYRWSGTGYVEVGPSLALGETASTAYRGDKGKALETEVNKLKETHVTTTLSVSGWNTSTKTYSFESTYPAATYDVEIEPINCNEAQAKAWGKMCPMTGSTSSNQLQIFGTIPTMDLPVLLTVRTK